MKRLLVRIWLRIEAMLKPKKNEKVELEVVADKISADEISVDNIELALQETLKNREIMNREYEQLLREDKKFEKELNDKLIGHWFKFFKECMLHEEYKHFKRDFNRNKLYEKKKRLGQKL